MLWRKLPVALAWPTSLAPGHRPRISITQMAYSVIMPAGAAARKCSFIHFNAYTQSHQTPMLIIDMTIRVSFRTQDNASTQVHIIVCATALARRPSIQKPTRFACGCGCGRGRWDALTLAQADYKAHHRSPCLPVSSCSVIRAHLYFESPSDMPLSQRAATSFLHIPPVFTNLQRRFKARMTSHSSTRTQKSKSSLSSRATKRRSFLPSLKLSSPSSSSWSSGDTTFSLKPVDSDPSAESTMPDIIVTPASPVCASALSSHPPLGTKITDRFWPEEDFENHDQDEILGIGKLSSPLIVNVLSPPPYYRRSQTVIVQQDNILSSDKYPSHYRNQNDSRPMVFPF
ncbi:hypothetical protein DEU56DRAFT_89470 [Suillus clintonianus]|uniref:uncharacterized protein n=1 Tax=Suillus clintonianus TaxID=1904413 RepID=UPI001B86E848|nr:uncharacterized protein DEU56DRAFT_89470 [Suillus clintonianus]KAG2121926.1 hypothetical protein DEU56DRAFT_89470 [Suillus clintonianus]